MKYWRIILLIGAMVGAFRTQAEDLSGLVLNIIDVSAVAETSEIVVHAVLTNNGKSKIKLENWIETGWGSNLDLTLIPKIEPASRQMPPITSSGTISNIVRRTSIVIAPGESVKLTGVFNPKRDAGVYNLSVSLRAMQNCVSKSRTVNLMESKGKTK